jgi:hypothetical protein
MTLDLFPPLLLFLRLLSPLPPSTGPSSGSNMSLVRPPLSDDEEDAIFSKHRSGSDSDLFKKVSYCRPIWHSLYTARSMRCDISDIHMPPIPSFPLSLHLCPVDALNVIFIRLFFTPPRSISLMSLSHPLPNFALMLYSPPFFLP